MKTNYQFIPTTNTLVLYQNKVLTLKRYLHLKKFPNWLMLPGGKQEKNETPQQTAIRETFEETGIKIIDPKLKIVATHNHSYARKIYLVYIFVAQRYSGTIKESKEGKPIWVSLRELLKNPLLYPDLKRHIKIITNSNQKEIVFTYHKFNKNLEIVESL